MIPHWLDKQAFLKPEDIAVQTADGQSLTFQELNEKSRMYASYFAEHGIKKGSHVGVLSSNCVDMIITIHALSYIGTVIVLLNTRLTPSEISFQLKDSEATYLITNTALKDKGRNSMEGTGIPPYHLLTYDEIQPFEKTIDVVTELELDQLFTILYTSGTTGKPKGVQLTYGNHWHSAVSSALNLGLSPNDKWLVCLPMFHVSGFSSVIKSALYGMPIYLVEDFDERAVNHAIKHQGVTMISVVSLMMERMLKELGGGGYPDHFRGMLLGGGPAPLHLLEQAKEKEILVYQTYGMTETSSQVATLSPGVALQKTGSAGKALSTAQLKIENHQTACVVGEVGEIKVKGPMVTKGYYKRPEANLETFNDGWLSTGDLGYLDEDGFLFVVDRRKDLIISGGENVYPAEIESVVTELKEVVEAGVIGKPDSQWGQVPVAFVVKEEHAHLGEEEVISHCKRRLAKYKVPTTVHFLEEVPRNASKKILRRKLVDLLSEMEGEE
ncbi:o-succinylbenzoate--CoA ligase [Thalassobacillus hwangdonensis]|uniref:2-succinylbenzoate--CoA ligase n=1 Tax=Thalassobacillus hwangdonensis TaxID=546108 RepID=A0ABW3L3G4_9BACI